MASGALAVRADHGARANALKDELGEEGAAAALLDKEGIKDFKFHATVQSRTADRMAGVPRAPLRGAAAAPAGGGLQLVWLRRGEWSARARRSRRRWCAPAAARD